jgi:hypothetical protein
MGLRVMNKRQKRAVQRLCRIFGGWPPLRNCPLSKVDIWDEVAVLLSPTDDVEAIRSEFNKARDHPQKFLPIKYSRDDHFCCLDCGVNVIASNDFCWLYFDVWEGELGLGWRDNLCIRCIEQRLGRKLKLADFNPSASVENRWRQK